MWYRALTRLSIGVERWGIFPARRLKPEALRVLEGRGFISPVCAPPIAEVLGWDERSTVLQAAGIVTLEDLLDARSVPNVEPAHLKTWIAEAKALLSIEHCRNCRRE